MILTIRQARLLLILSGKSDESAIRPGEFTALEANDLVQALRAFAAGQKKRFDMHFPVASF